MKTKFTRLLVFAVTGKTNISMRLLPVFICSIFSCCIINSYAQQGGNTKPGKAASSQNFNLPHFHRSWLTTGNSGTDTSINFIGTRDAQPLIFKVNNQKAGYLDFDSFSRNTTFGYQCLISDIVTNISGITGSDNSAFGYSALYSNISGEVNTAIGSNALHFNTEGNVNTAIGGFSLASNTTGAFNTAIGSFPLFINTTGSFNVATGDYALFNNTTGSANIANGAAFTLAGNTEGSDNIATGVLALTSNTTGNANIAYGSYSMASNATGNNNTALGFGADVAADNLNNATAIGNGALVDASNKVIVGNADVTSIGGQVGWTSFSDERIKDNVKENVPGLEFIKALRPVTYHFNIAKENDLRGVKEINAKAFQLPAYKGTNMQALKYKMEALKNVSKKEENSLSNKTNYNIEKMQFTGFLAQDVDKAAKGIGYDFSGIDKSGKIMGLRYSDFVVPLVKAVQELSQQNEDLKKQNNNLEQRIEKLEAMMNMQQSTTNNQQQIINLSSASLDQNKPNPFIKTTTIAYSLPQKFSSAQIIITDQKANVLRRINIISAGKGTVNIDAAILSSGEYNYSLMIDGHITDTKKMVLTK